MAHSPITEERGARRWSRCVSVGATILMMMLAYGLAKHWAAATSNILDRRHFSVEVDPGDTYREHPVIAIREGTPLHIEVRSKEAGILMVDEIPGAAAACASGTRQSLDIFPLGITGRFSLHFHRLSGAEVKVATIEIYPEP
ncbi:hypothetical protein PQR05_33525 [Paraburkholderia sediminicola]|uniref:Uncharacterized protein n=1 Tax=Paraburkholderia metrosideri TaxID=580937 RepID=A0ABW9E4C1_9BURK